MQKNWWSVCRRQPSTLALCARVWRLALAAAALAAVTADDLDSVCANAGAANVPAATASVTAIAVTLVVSFRKATTYFVNRKFACWKLPSLKRRTSWRQADVFTHDLSVFQT